ncbi:zinc finger HIT domain-containing protein 2 [Corythoichthys intestinalis]|uniref:zinc finger HIT domain-containing protein 2 n=1 Tax=Corythoichthys intestinalis TaxID=161448 RepID=UPI0025A5C567|nr:zinc finger HIT domain-containing protein 2 [Corythoichthys intestinalis]XP_061794137.1 zinc finger HIT domain-containing protein 2-like [Nerophis lumbriciformis]
MNPNIRRTLPPSVRSLLTDIGPKDECLNEEDEASAAVCRDGILLPGRRHEEFITQADGKNSKVCMLCNCQPACYTCPRCNLHYCGVACYRSPDHTFCSEEFYKESVLEELKNMGETDLEGRKKMQDILLGLRQKAQLTNGGMKSVLTEIGIEQQNSVEAMDLLSRLAELQESEADHGEEIEDILRTLEELGGQEADDESSESVAQNLSELDLDKLSEEELWALLDSREKEKFTGLLKGDALGVLIPVWKPWWEEHDKTGRALVEVLEEEVQNPDQKVQNPQSKNKIRSNAVSGVPVISAKIPKLSSLCRNPSPLVCYGIINTLYCYTFTLQLFNGDPDSLLFEFCDMMLTLSEALSASKVFNSVQEAIRSGETLILEGGYLKLQESRGTDLAVEAAAHVLTGRDKEDATGYMMSALSQTRSVFSRARTALSKEGEEGAKRQKYFQASKKCEFFQAWLLDHSHRCRELALEMWNEHSRRVGERKSMEKSKKLVEERLKKGKKINSTLIQEIN